MDVGKRKEEILMLIGQLKASRAAAASTAQDDVLRTVAQREPILNDTLARRSPEQRIELRTVERAPPASADVTRHLQAIDQRLSAIEEMLSKSVANALSPPSVVVRSMGPPTSMKPNRLGPGSVAAPQLAAPMHTLAGIVREGVLADIIQYLNSNSLTGVLTIDSPGGSVKIYLSDGELFSATCGSMRGQDAFFAAMAISSGAFAFDETTEIPGDRTIDGNTQLLILEGLRQADEGKASDEERQREKGK